MRTAFGDIRTSGVSCIVRTRRAGSRYGSRNSYDIRQHGDFHVEFRVAGWTDGASGAGPHGVLSGWPAREKNSNLKTCRCVPITSSNRLFSAHAAAATQESFSAQVIGNRQEAGSDFYHQ
jgi:hypothetical protein